jgi:hypothetical protein
MSQSRERSPSIRHYFVDEAGDSTLFNRQGRIIVGIEGCSCFFILGLADIPDPVTLGREMEALRARLLADPYFKGVPSMQPEARKTALAFHAKDDLLGATTSLRTARGAVRSVAVAVGQPGARRG